MAPLERHAGLRPSSPPKGVSVLTLRVLSEGNMNFAYLEFKSRK